MAKTRNMDKFTQTHGLDMTDMNSDGHPDLVTGKRTLPIMGKIPENLNLQYYTGLNLNQEKIRSGYLICR
jgi:hypothetical protein